MKGQFSFRGARGWKLAGYFWKGEGGKRTLALVHGYGEHAGRYEEFACWLVENGANVAAFDLRGHGKSPGKRGHIAAFDEYLEDLQSFLTVLRQWFPDTVLFLLGHSLGGLIVARYLERYSGSAVGAVLISPAMEFAVSVPLWKRALAHVASCLHPSFSLPSGIAPEALSHDPEVVEAYRRDPLVHRVATARWFVETLRAQREALREAHRIAVPVLVVYGTADRIISPEAVVRFFEASGSPQKEIFSCGGFYHEPLNEVGREEVWARVLRWIREIP